MIIAKFDILQIDTNSENVEHGLNYKLLEDFTKVYHFLLLTLLTL